MNGNLREIVENCVAKETFARGRKDLIVRMINDFEDYLVNINKSYNDIGKEDVIIIIKSIKTRSYSAMLQYHMAINDILRYINKLDCKLIINNEKDVENDIDLHSIVEDEPNRYYTKDEIINLCDRFVNAQDKFIVYGLFCGIHGKQNNELLNLKSKDIDLVNNIIKIEDRTIHLDDYMKKICGDMIDPFVGGTYFKYMDLDNPNKNGTSSESYELNFDSEYAIKTKPYSKNNQGLNLMKNEGVKRRLNKLAEVSKMPISQIDIARSGVMYRMNKIKKEGWTQAEIEEYLKQTGFKMRAYELKRIYEMKYNKRVDSDKINESREKDLNDASLKEKNICEKYHISYTPKPKGEFQIEKGRKQWKTNDDVKNNVRINKKHMCEYDISHKYFISQKTNHNYVEGHHLIPMRYQDEFNYSIDTEANVISLCPVCHKMIHLGRFEDKIDILNKLYNSRSEQLSLTGINITFEELLNYYK